MKVKYVIANINTIDVEEGIARVDVLYKDKDLHLWGPYDVSDKDLLLFDTREKADHYIKDVFGDKGLYISYGVKVRS